MTNTTCVVTGATGYIGGRLAPRLIDRGHTVRALVRTPSKLADAPWATEDTVVKGDLSDRASLDRAFEGADVVYHLVHSMGGSDDFMAEERRTATNLAEAAKAAGVSRIVYLSGLHPLEKELSDHLTSRVEVGEIFIASGVDTIVLQAGVVIGTGSASFELIRHLTDRLPIMTTPRWVHNKIQPIAVRDALYYLAEAATVPITESRTYDIGGSEVFEYGDMMQIYAEAAGLRRRRMVVLPYLTPSIASRWVRLVTPVPSGLARPLIESLEHDAVMHEHDIDDLIPRPEGGLLTYRQALDAALDRKRRADTNNSWSNADASVPAAEPLPTDPSWAGEDVFTDTRSVSTTASPDALWKVVSTIGGDNGWYSTPLVWSARAAVDGVVGGPGLRRTTSGTTATEGEALDWWRVTDVEDGSKLRLRAETKMPGVAWLELRVVPEGSGARLEQKTTFYARGLAGLAYWYGQLPFHKVIFSRMAHNIVSAAEASH